MFRGVRLDIKRPRDSRLWGSNWSRSRARISVTRRSLSLSLYLYSLLSTSTSTLPCPLSLSLSLPLSPQHTVQSRQPTTTHCTLYPKKASYRVKLGPSRASHPRHHHRVTSPQNASTHFYQDWDLQAQTLVPPFPFPSSPNTESSPQTLHNQQRICYSPFLSNIL